MVRPEQPQHLAPSKQQMCDPQWPQIKALLPIAINHVADLFISLNWGIFLVATGPDGGNHDYRSACRSLSFYALRFWMH